MAKGATVDVPMHWAYLMGIWRNVPMSHDEKKKDVYYPFLSEYYRIYAYFWVKSRAKKVNK